MSRHRFRREFMPFAMPKEKFDRTVADAPQTQAKRMHLAVRMQTKPDADCWDVEFSKPSSKNS